MSSFDIGSVSFDDLASEVFSRCVNAIEQSRLQDVPDEALGQMYGGILRIFAEKAQAGCMPKPFGRNSGVTATDVVIGCSAMLNSANLAVFELAAWQAVSRLGIPAEQLKAEQRSRHDIHQ
ncbi:hypothetical protein [Tardiphaga sp.]|uniref:hypothetical protein n=1 Tax=Tardiphaga sp. TaxID=1926292 RepID=UPI0025CCB17E|nr:hypothetical protein [Tardiphaga sp.]